VATDDRHEERAIHGYFDMDVDLVWSVAQNDLPELGAQVRAIVGELS
jgi:uncharacterized protein with HEPN domain